MGFGFGAFLGGPILSLLIGSVGIAQTFFLQAISYTAIMLLSSACLKLLPPDWQPARKKVKPGKIPAQGVMPMTANQAVRTRCFLGLWLRMFINITCGIALICVASPLAQEATGISALAAGRWLG